MTVKQKVVLQVASNSCYGDIAAPKESVLQGALENFLLPPLPSSSQCLALIATFHFPLSTYTCPYGCKGRIV